jgi:magnesium-transporting ATPase (P-type)
MNDPAKLSIQRQLIRWLLLAVFILLALFFLNGALYSAWVSGGPPNPYPTGWFRRAIAQLCFALAAVSFGAGLFKAVRTFPGATKETAAFILLGAVLAITPYIGQFVLIGNCHDRGGNWNRETIQCSDE